MFISASEDKTGTLDVIEEKIARATMIPRTHGEAFNVLRYNLGQRYNSHYDAFSAAEYGPQKSQRNGLNMNGNYDFEECVGLKVKPQKGDGLLFYSLFPNGTIDPTSLHGSCPVIKGEKWVATKWIRDEEQDD
ncbi:Putative prolyl 4-hydroxylase [Morus notabilis]|uniref:Putative prolyl 4-hydroxylase n=1 Tax=Morus notabilis TaxID=981085 RepID=W9QMJ9_9ROSA|nr:Putative prolyl 4-hydroxylase [Morus notabilis]